MASTKNRLLSRGRLRNSLVTAALLAVLFGCTYGKLVLLPPDQDNIDTFIQERYQNLDAFYSGTADKPGVLRFDIKGDDVLLTGPGWQPLANKEEVLQIVRNIQNTYRKYRGSVGARGPRLYAIMDEKNQPVGYVYSPIDEIPVRQDGKNVELDALTEVDVRNLANPIERTSRKWGGGMGGPSPAY